MWLSLLKIMKKSLNTVILLLFIIVASTTFSYVKAQLSSKFGIKGGLNYATNYNVDGADYKVGLLVGLNLDIELKSLPFSIQTELLYTQYGINVNSTGETQSQDYIQLPVLFNYRFDINTIPVNPNFYLGPYVSFNSAAEYTDESGNTQDNDEFIKDFDFGIISGLGFDVGRINLSLRYTVGLSNVYIESLRTDAKNSAFSLIIGANF